jgi:hypothetical protein
MGGTVLEEEEEEVYAFLQELFSGCEDTLDWTSPYPSCEPVCGVLRVAYSS